MIDFFVLFCSAQRHSGPYRKNTKPNRNYNHQDQNKHSPAHNYHESLRRWGGYSSPGETLDSAHQVHDQMRRAGAGRGQPRRWSNPRGGGKMKGLGMGGVGYGGGGGGGGGGGANRSMARGRYSNRNASWLEEYPRPQPPLLQPYGPQPQHYGQQLPPVQTYGPPQPPIQPFMGDIQQSQLVRKPGTGAVGGMEGGGGGGGGDIYGYQSAPAPRYQYGGGGIRQSQLVKRPDTSKQGFRRSSSPSEGDTSSFKPSPSPQRDSDGSQAVELRFDSGNHYQPPLQPPSSSDPSETTGGLASGSSLYKGLTQEQIKNEVGWYTSGIERAVKKVRWPCTCTCVYVDGKRSKLNGVLNCVCLIWCRLCACLQVPPLISLAQRLWSCLEVSLYPAPGSNLC